MGIKKKITTELKITVSQGDPVFCYLCNSIGEELNINRFETDQNDLEEAVNQYRVFNAMRDKNQFKAVRYDEQGIPTIDKKCKIIPIQDFQQSVASSWVIDTYWTDEEKVELGFKEPANILTIPELQALIDVVVESIAEYKEDLECLI